MPIRDDVNVTSFDEQLRKIHNCPDKYWERIVVVTRENGKIDRIKEAFGGFCRDGFYSPDHGKDGRFTNRVTWHTCNPQSEDMQTLVMY